MKRLIVLAILLAIPTFHALDRMSDPARGERERTQPVVVKVRGKPRVKWISRRERNAPVAIEARAVESDPMATPDRADADAQSKLDRAVNGWLAESGVPRTWTPPRQLVAEQVQSAHTQEVHKEYGTVYIKTLQADFSPYRRSLLIDRYDREVRGRRLVTLGAVLAFALICLASLNGYIRADEATKGYYTNRLRLASAAGVGAAGFALYRMLV